MLVGLVGAGQVGARRAEVVHAFEGTELAVVADTDLGRARNVSAAYGGHAVRDWEEVIAREEVGVVIVSTPNKFLMPVSLSALEHGKHVLCEKPLARTPEEAQRMVDAARANRVVLKTGFNHRYHPAIFRAREAVARGTLGDLEFIRCRYGHGGRPGYEREWRGDPEMAGGGELLDQGVHAFDLLRWFMGEFRELTGFVDTRFWDIAPLEDNAFVLLRTDAGQTASVHVSWTQWKNLFSFEVFGREGYAIVEGLGGSYGTERLTLGRRRPESGPPEEQTVEFSGPDRSWHDEWVDFVTALKEGREPMGSGYDGLQVLRLVYATYEAARDSRIVRLHNDEEETRRCW